MSGVQAEVVKPGFSSWPGSVEKVAQAFGIKPENLSSPPLPSASSPFTMRRRNREPSQSINAPFKVPIKVPCVAELPVPAGESA